MIKYINYVVFSYLSTLNGDIDKHCFVPMGYFQSQDDALKFMRSYSSSYDLFLGELGNPFMIYSHL